MNELTTKQETQLCDKQTIYNVINHVDILDTSLKDIITISSRFDKNEPAKFYTIDEQKLEIIASNMTEINRAVRSFGRRNTFTNNKLMTLTMLNDTNPYRVLRQCLSEIEQKRMAIRENYFKILKQKLKLKKLYNDIYENDKLNEYKKEKTKIKIMELLTGISDSMVYLEGAFKEIASFQNAYEQVRKNNNIPENWDEKDFEENETKFNVRQAFLLGIRDIFVNNCPNHGTMEYMQQMGMNFISAYTDIRKYINENFKNIENNTMPSYDDLQDFLDDMAEKYGKDYKFAMKRIGLETISDEEFLYKENNK